MIIDRVDRRILVGLRFVDVVSGVPITEPLRVTAQGVRWIRTRRAYYVIDTAPGFSAYADSFVAPDVVPADVAIEYLVEDPTGRLLPRRGRVTIPRDANPTNAEADKSVFRAFDVALFPSPTSDISPGWAVVRASTLPHALIRVIRQSNGEPSAVIGRGMSDARGEALIAVQGIPITTFAESSGPVLATEVAVDLQVIRADAAPPPPDPDALEAAAATLLVRSSTAMLAAGRLVTLEL